MTAQTGALTNLTATAAVPTGGALNVYAKFVLGSSDATTVLMTSYDGHAYGVDGNNKLISVTDGALAAGTQYGRATWTVTYYYDEACTDQNAVPSADYGQIDAVGTITLYVKAGTRSRVSLTAPTAKGTTDDQSNTRLFGENFGPNLGNYVTVSVESIENGVVSWASNNDTIYYAIYGGAATDTGSLKDKTTLDAALGTAQQGDGESGFSQTLTVSKTQPNS